MAEGSVIAKRLAMVLAVITIIEVARFYGGMTATASKTQMMEISCPHCHETITIDVLLDDVECPKCLKNIHIDG